MSSGRPSDYTPELADSICERLSDGQSLVTICAADDMPGKSTVFRWLAAHAEFRDKYVRARETQADHMAEEILQIADEGVRDTYLDGDGVERTDHDVIARSRLRVDTRKWLMSKMAPKKYGDKLTTELTGPGGGPVQQVTRIELVAADGNAADQASA